MKKLIFIYNPAAGTGKVRGQLGDIVQCFADNGYEVTLHPTTGRGDATDFVRQRAGEFHRVVCAGGDGTLNEVVTGLLDAENPPPLGYIPTGTTNDFSHTLEIPTDLMDAAECAARGGAYGVDVGLFNARPFIYVAAFGLFSDVSYTTPQEIKHTLGHLAYVLSGIPQLANITPYHMKVSAGDVEIEDDFIYGMVSDTISVGGLLELNRNDVRINDGNMELFLIRFPQNPIELGEIIGALMQHTPCKNIITLQGSSFRFSGQTPVPWTLDGEYGGTTETAEISVLQQAVRLVTRKRVLALKPEEKE